MFCFYQDISIRKEIFYDKNSVSDYSKLKKGEVIGHLVEGERIFSTRNCRNRKIITKFSVLTDKRTEKTLQRLEKMIDNIDGENSVSITDPESKRMEDKKGIMGLNYNYQVGIDSKFEFIIGNYVTQNPNDQNELLTIVNRIKPKTANSKENF